MKTVKMGRTPIEVSQLGFGGLPLKNMDVETGMRLIKKVLDCNINFFDTARSYGYSENIIGRGVSGYRKNVILCSKTKETKLRKLMDDFEESFSKLKTNLIDIYMLHDVRNLDSAQKREEVKIALEYLNFEKKGKLIRAVGVSLHRLEVLDTILSLGDIDVVMFPFNFIENEALTTGFIKKCRKYGVGMVVMKPIGGGMIKYPEKSLQWIGRTLKDAVVIPGMTNKEEVEANSKLFEKSMKFPRNFPELWEEKSRLDYKFCRRCEYCLPCPEGINPSIIIQWRELMNNRDGGYISNNKLTEIQRGLNCTQCGECESKCPYGLKLTELVPAETRLILDKAGVKYK